MSSPSNDGDGCPPPPDDAEVVRNIQVLAAFVAKHGPPFELLALRHTSGDPKFAFLSSDSPSNAFYLWKKSRLQRRIFASDGSDDLQRKICMMVDDPLPSSSASMDHEKVLEAMIKKSSGVDAGAEGSRSEIAQDKTDRKTGHLSHRSRFDEQRQNVQPQSSTADKVDRRGSVADDSARRLHRPVQASKDDLKRTSAIDVETKELSLAKADLKDSVQHPSSDTATVMQCDANVGTGAHSDGSRGKKDGEMDLQAADMTEKQAKEAYGLKLLKAALADYVKEVLKPAWKEGNMSKDSFKAIVKKVVDKVCGSLQGHQIPKTQENVEQYMAQSQVKIAKLVQGYVEKFKKT